MVLPVLERAGNVATTFSLRPHGSGLQHDVHTFGQSIATLEHLFTPALSNVRQDIGKDPIPGIACSKHLRRCQQAGWFL